MTILGTKHVADLNFFSWAYRIDTTSVVYSHEEDIEIGNPRVPETHESEKYLITLDPVKKKKKKGKIPYSASTHLVERHSISVCGRSFPWSQRIVQGSKDSFREQKSLRGSPASFHW